MSRKEIHIWHIDPVDKSFTKSIKYIANSEKTNRNNDLVYISDDPTPISFMLRNKLKGKKLRIV